MGGVTVRYYLVVFILGGFLSLFFPASSRAAFLMKKRANTEVVEHLALVKTSLAAEKRFFPFSLKAPNGYRYRHFHGRIVGGGGFRGFLSFTCGLAGAVAIPLTFTTMATAAGIAPALFLGGLALGVGAIILGGRNNTGLGRAGLILGGIDVGVVALLMVISYFVAIGRGNGSADPYIFL